jgi:hypothetical protein
VLTAIITILYTLLGGVEAVVWSDVVQGFVLWAGILVSIGFLLFLPHQGAGAVLADAWNHGKMGLGSTALRFDKPTVIVLVIYGFFFYVQKYTADQSVVQRYLIAKSDRSALKGITLGAVLCVPVWTAFMLIGSLLWSFYRLTGEKLPLSIHKSDQIFPHFLVTHIPPGLAGLFTAALLGSAMAMLASDMNCLSVIGVEDFYASVRPRSDDRQRLLVGRIIVAASGLAAAGVALKLAHSPGWRSLALLHHHCHRRGRACRTLPSRLPGATCHTSGSHCRNRGQPDRYCLGDGNAGRKDAGYGPIQLSMARLHDWSDWARRALRLWRCFQSSPSRFSSCSRPHSSGLAAGESAVAGCRRSNRALIF